MHFIRLCFIKNLQWNSDSVQCEPYLNPATQRRQGRAKRQHSLLLSFFSANCLFSVHIGAFWHFWSVTIWKMSEKRKIFCYILFTLIFLELMMIMHGPIQPIWPIFEVNGLDWHCCLAGSSKMAHRIFIFSIAIGADYSYEVKNSEI